MQQTIGAVLTLLPPQSSVAAHTIQAPYLSYEATTNDSARIVFAIADNWLKEHYSLFFVENSVDPVNHPAQVKGCVHYQENGDYILRYAPIVSITRDIDKGEPVIVLTAEDRLRVVKDTLASYTPGSTPFYTFKRETGAVDAGSAAAFPGAQTRVQLYPEVYVAGTQRWKYFPKYDANAWLPTSFTGSTLGYQDSLGANITNVATEIPLGANYKGFRPSGWVLIESEYIQYDGYTYDQANTRWVLNNCKRGKLGGGAAAAHSTPLTVYAIVPKRIHASEAILVEGYDSTTYEAIPQDDFYTVNAEEGCFVFNQDPTTIGVRDTGGTAYVSLWATYGVYDEDDAGATALYLGADVLTDMLKATVANLGPGFEDTAAGDGLELCTVLMGFSPDIPLTEFSVERPTYCWEALRQLLSDLGLNKGLDKDALLIRDNPRTGANRIEGKTITQATTPDKYFHGAETRSETVDLDPVKSAFLVRSTGNDNINLLGSPRYRHTQGELSAASTKPWVFHKWRLTGTGITWGSHTGTNYGPGGGAPTQALKNGWPSNVRLAQLMEANDSWPSLIFDNNPDTGFALYWTSQANCQSTTNKQNELYFWFPGASDTAPDLYSLDKFMLALDMYGKSDSATTRQLDINIYAITSFTDGAPPTRTLKGLGTNSRFIMSPGQHGTNDTDGTEIIELNGHGVLCYGICIVINRGQIPLNSGIIAGGFTGYGISILDIAAFGTPYTYNAVKLKAAYSSADKGDSLTAVTTAAKLLDSNLGNHTVGLMDVGPCSRSAALNLGVLQLLTNLAGTQVREYTVRSIGMDMLDTSGKPAFPLIGDTLKCLDDGFSGVCSDISYRVEKGARSMRLRLVNYDTSLFGTAAN